MQVAVTGSSGLIGHALSARLAGAGHAVVPLVRGPSSDPRAVRWDPERGELDPERLRGVDAVVHLAGESFSGEGLLPQRWTPAKRRRLLQSRVRGTATLAEGLATLADGPRTLVCASAIGFYGDRGDEVLTEDSGPGGGFLAEVVQAWEAAAYPAREAGLRVVHTRIGIVQTPAGGALARLARVFRLTGAARFGNGRQYMSWVSLDDVAAALQHAVESQAVGGVVNVTAPTPVTNAEYTRILARVLRRPVLPVGVPAFAPGLLVGRDLVSELLYFSQRVLPERLPATGFSFADRDLETALRRLLER